MRVVIETDEHFKVMLLEIAQAINAKIEFQEDDFYDNLPEFVKIGVSESKQQILQGDVYRFEDIKNELINRKVKI